MLSQTVEYALRAVCYLAGRNPDACTTGEIAEATRVPAAYLSKVLQNLTHEGILHSRRGVGGGMSLVKSPDELTILEVVDAVDPIHRIKECPLGLASHGTNLCPLHHKLDAALASMEKAFRDTTLADVLAEPTTSIPLCDFPPAKPEG